MPMLIQNRDLKTLFSGAAVAVAAGLLFGGVFYPDLNAGAVKGPQMEMSGGGPRAVTEVSDAGVSTYNGHVPDYVIGTDALKPPVYQVLSYEERAEPEAADTGDQGDVMAYEAPAQTQPVQIQTAGWRDAPREATRYPSQSGNAVHEVDLPAAPPPPSAIDEEPVSG